MLPFAGGLAGFILNKKVIYHIHETTVSPALFKSFLRKIISITASKIIYVSESLKKDETFNKQNETIIYNAIEKDFLNNALEKKQENFTIFMACSLRDYKGINEFLKIASRIYERNYNLNFNIVLNATDSEISDYFKGKKIPSNTNLFSKKNNLHPFYQEASILLNLSRIDQWVETFGLTIIEGMAYGLPSIVPPVGGPAEIVQNGIQGYCISSYEVNKIAEKIIELSINKELYQQLSINAKERVKDFSEEEFNKQIIEFINA